MADLNELIVKFWQDVSWFNTHSFPVKPHPSDSPYDRFDDRIKMKKIDDPGKYHEGIGQVYGYFTGNGTSDKALFLPDGPPDFELFDDGHGVVSGTANFVYKTVPTRDPTRKIAYSFAYTNTSGEWKGIHLWGQYID